MEGYCRLIFYPGLNKSALVTVASSFLGVSVAWFVVCSQAFFPVLFLFLYVCVNIVKMGLSAILWVSARRKQ